MRVCVVCDAVESVRHLLEDIERTTGSENPEHVKFQLSNQCFGYFECKNLRTQAFC